MFDITSFRGRHRCVATFLDMVKSTFIASLPHPPNTSTTKEMHDNPLRAFIYYSFINLHNNNRLKKYYQYKCP